MIIAFLIGLVAGGGIAYFVLRNNPSFLVGGLDDLLSKIKIDDDLKAKFEELKNKILKK